MWKFDGILFDTFFNSKGVYRYRDKNGRIKLAVGYALEDDTNDYKIFDRWDDYETFIDRVVDSNDYYYNKARALLSVISAIEHY